MVLYFIHGGGFIIDSGGSACAYWHELLKVSSFSFFRKFHFLKPDDIVLGNEPQAKDSILNLLTRL